MSFTPGTRIPEVRYSPSVIFHSRYFLYLFSTSTPPLLPCVVYCPVRHTTPLSSPGESPNLLRSPSSSCEVLCSSQFGVAPVLECHGCRTIPSVPPPRAATPALVWTSWCFLCSKGGVKVGVQVRVGLALTRRLLTNSTGPHGPTLQLRLPTYKTSVEVMVPLYTCDTRMKLGPSPPHTPVEAPSTTT